LGDLQADLCRHGRLDNSGNVYFCEVQFQPDNLLYERLNAEAQLMILRILSRRFGTLSPDVNAVVMALPVAKLEDLGEALLDFQEIADLQNWLQANR
jgi:hypothetical protein